MLVVATTVTLRVKARRPSDTSMERSRQDSSNGHHFSLRVPSFRGYFWKKIGSETLARVCIFPLGVLCLNCYLERLYGVQLLALEVEADVKNPSSPQSN